MDKSDEYHLNDITEHSIFKSIDEIFGLFYGGLDKVGEDGLFKTRGTMIIIYNLKKKMVILKLILKATNMILNLNIPL